MFCTSHIPESIPYIPAVSAVIVFLLQKKNSLMMSFEKLTHVAWDNAKITKKWKAVLDAVTVPSVQTQNVKLKFKTFTILQLSPFCFVFVFLLRHNWFLPAFTHLWPTAAPSLYARTGHPGKTALLTIVSYKTALHVGNESHIIEFLFPPNNVSSSSYNKTN